MHKIKNYKIDYFFVVAILLFMIISITTIYSSNKLLSGEVNLAIKQLVWYVVGFIVIIVTIKSKNFVYKNIEIIYILGNIALLLLLLFAPTINNSKCWFVLPYNIGTIQPSEFMKIILIILLAKKINQFNLKE